MGCSRGHRGTSPRCTKPTIGSSYFGQLVTLSPMPCQTIVSLGIAREALYLRIPMQLPSALPRDVREATNADRAVPDLHIGQRRFPAPHAVQPVLHVVLRLPLRPLPFVHILLRRYFLDEIGRISSKVVPRDLHSSFLGNEHCAALQISPARLEARY